MQNRADYKAALGRLMKPDWREAVKQLNDYLLQQELFSSQNDLYNYIDKHSKSSRQTETKILGNGTYKKFIIDKLYADNKQSIGGPSGKKNAIQYLLFFYDEFKVWLAYENGTIICTYHTGTEIRNKHDESVYIDTVTFKPQGPVDDDDSVFYDVFYWRTTRDDIGIAKLRFYNGLNDWKNAELVYHYLTVGKGKEYASLNGNVYWNGENTYIDFIDTVGNIPEGSSPIRSFWSLFVSKDPGKRDYLAGVFASSNRDTHEPVCGKLLLKRNDQNHRLDQSDFIGLPNERAMGKALQGVPDDIFYAISNARLTVPSKPVLSEPTIPYHEQVEKLKTFAGTYQVFQPWHNAELNLKKIVISTNGKVALSGGNEDTMGFVDYCDKTLVIKFAYDAEAAYYKFYFMVEKIPESRDLTGIYAGLTRGQDLISGRLYLCWQDTGNFATGNHSAPNRSYFDELRHTNPGVHAFLTNQLLRSTDNLWISHLNETLLNSQQKVKTIQPPAYLDGSYNLFFLTKFEHAPRKHNPDHRTLLPEQPVQLIQMPLFIEGNRVEITDGTLKVEGDVYYDGVNGLMISFQELRFWSSLMISIPKPGHHQTPQHKYHYGTMARIDKEPEASALILYREKDPTYLLYRCFEKFSELMEIEQRYRGLVSFLFGDWGRFVRMTGHEKYTHDGFPRKYETFRRAFFAAACYHGSRPNEETLCLNNLQRAFRQGFGLYRYGRIDSNHPQFPKEILEERNMLRKAINVYLKDETVIRYVKLHWKLDEYP